MKLIRTILNALLAAGLQVSPSLAAEQPESQPHEVIVAFDSTDLKTFEKNAAAAAKLGATHVVVTENLPNAYWEFDVPDDPYPAWFMHHPSLLEVFPPKEVQPYVNKDYAEKVAGYFEERCKILRRYGLKAVYSSNEPHVLPEAFFTAYPALRGPQIDQPNRSRSARFAPCVDNPETLRLYRESMQLLLQRCPEIEVFTFVTTDAGSGFCWTPGLYPGKNGNTECKDRPMAERVSGFMTNLQQSARVAGHEIEISINQIAPRQWMLPTFDSPMSIVHLLPRGLAVNGLEGPDGRRFMSGNAGGSGQFYPVLGIPQPIGFFKSVPRDRAGRYTVRMGDASLTDFYFRLFDDAQKLPAPKNDIVNLLGVREFGAAIVGEDHADDLLSLWLATDEVAGGLEELDFGPVLKMGGVLNRWVTRPMVPFPAELTAQEKSYYWRFLFQAKGVEQANDLIDIQAMRMYEGWGAKMLVQHVIEGTDRPLRQAIACAERLRAAAKDDASRHEWELMGKRLEVLQCLIRTTDNMVSYQAQLDRVKSLGLKPEPNPVLGTQNGWDRTDLMQTARSEIDNAVKLKALLEGTQEPLIDTAPTAEEESIMRLGPDLPAQLKRKIDIMDGHWEDYKRLFTTPNP